jgi:predicted ATP-dependent serine protease
MTWDPSKATTTCRGCGYTIEAWLTECDDCEAARLQEIEELLHNVEEFETRFEDLVADAKDIEERLKRLGDERTAERMQLYFINRMKNFLQGREMFTFDQVRNSLNDILKEYE